MKEKKDGEEKLLYSDKYLRTHYSHFESLNESETLKRFLRHYYKIGNVIPTWPGANTHRGNSHCYDIPNVYYKRYIKFTKLFIENVYENVFLDKVLAESKYCAVADLLTMDKEGYVTFLNYIIKVIQERTDLIEKFLQGNKNCE